MDCGDPDGADRHFARAARLMPGRVEPLLSRARLSLCRGEVEQAEDLLRRALALQKDAGAAVLLARLLVQRDALGEAEAIIGEAVGHAPDHPLLLLCQGEVLLGRGDLAAAEDCFQRAEGAGAAPLTVRACRARVRLAEGNQLFGRGLLNEAAFRYKSAADLSPGWAEPLAQLAMVLGRLGNVRRAVELCERAVALAPYAAEVQHRLGTLLRDAGAIDRAIVAFERAMQADPLHLSARRALADLISVRQPARALLLYAEEVVRTPTDAALWASLGEVCLRCGDRRQAARCFRESLRLDMGDLRAAELLVFAEKRTRRRDAGNTGPGPLSKTS
jgi:tetratricopeptide (TPR) repeat protein